VFEFESRRLAVKNFSMPRLAIVLWFLNYTFFSLFWYVLNSGRHLISGFLVYSTFALVVELICLGLIEDLAN